MEKTFELKSLKIIDGDVDIKYRVVESEDDAVNENDFHVKSTRMVPRDIENLLEQDLARIVAAIFDNSEDIAEFALGNSKIVPQGISFAGNDDKKGIVISGAYRTKFGKCKFKTPRIKYLAGDNDVCAKLTVFANAIVTAVQAYLSGSATVETGTFGE